MRLSGALIGLAVFFVGIGLLYTVFQIARTLFDAPPPPIALPSPAPSPTATPAVPEATPTTAPASGIAPAPTPAASPSPDAITTTVTTISGSLFGFGRQWLLLLLMCIAGSFIASRGIELFFRACAASVVHPPKSAASPPAKTEP